ncbi:MAG: hypothetical protein WAW71_11265, partial [Propioniciclava sp.]
ARLALSEAAKAATFGPLSTKKHGHYGGRIGQVYAYSNPTGEGSGEPNQQGDPNAEFCGGEGSGKVASPGWGQYRESHDLARKLCLSLYQFGKSGDQEDGCCDESENDASHVLTLRVWLWVRKRREGDLLALCM